MPDLRNIAQNLGIPSSLIEEAVDRNRLADVICVEVQKIANGGVNHEKKVEQPAENAPVVSTTVAPAPEKKVEVDPGETKTASPE